MRYRPLPTGITLLGLLTLIVFPIHAEPIVHQATGEFSAGESVVIEGLGFGFKPSPAPYFFDDFEDGAEGQTIGTGGGDPAWQVDFDPGGMPPRYVPGRRHPTDLHAAGQTVGVQEDGSFQHRCGLVLPAADLAEVYVSGWFYWQHPDHIVPSSPNSLHLLDHGQMGSPGTGTVRLRDLGGALRVFTESLACDGQSAMGQSTPLAWPEAGSWQRLEYWRTIDGITGSETVTVTIGDQPAHQASGPMGSGCPPGSVGLLTYASSPLGEGALDLFWSEVYVDVTRARVELGDAADFDDCTHREIQVPQVWTDSMIQIACRPGSFAFGDQVYVFVIDGQGAASTGYPVMIGGEEGSVPGQPSPPTVNFVD